MSNTNIDLKNINKIHMIGIGGVSMSGVAVMLKRAGFTVTGSDAFDGDMIKILRNENIPVHIGHSKDLVKNADLIVYTAAIKDSDEELSYAHEIGKPTLERAPFIGILLKEYEKPICIAGMHGKTTTTSMIASSFMHLDTHPTVLVGSKLKELGDVNYLIGENKYFVLEACEYVDSFLNFPPETAVILNIEEEHLDYFKDINQIKQSFIKFISMLPKNGKLIINKDDENCNEVLLSLQSFIQENNITVLTYSLKNKSANLYADNIAINENGCYKYDLYLNGKYITNISLNAPGKHNVANSLATVGSIYANNLDILKAKEGIENFTGASRRFEYKKTIGDNVNVYDDYAHHPTEIKATLESARNKSKNRVIAVFQPHTYSRTKLLFDKFAHAFNNADFVILTDIYAAREAFDKTISSKMLADELVRNGINAMYISSFEDIAKKIKEIIEPNDIVLTIGAGTITKLSDLL